MPTPEDFPDAYDYGSGRISDFDRLSNFRHLPEPENGATVLQPGDRTILFIQTQFSKKVMQYFKGRE